LGEEIAPHIVGFGGRGEVFGEGRKSANVEWSSEAEDLTY